MNSRKTPKTHLVPVIKGVSDPAKGLIFRTYHVRPEQLQKSLQQATTKPEKTHISKIPNYDKLSKSISSNDITHLRGMFGNNSKVWNKLVTRDSKASANSSRSKQKLMQSIYAYTLSQDAMFTTSMKTHAKGALDSQSVKIEHNENPQKHTSNTAKRSTVHESVSYKPTLQDDSEILMPTVLPAIQNKYSLTVAKNTTPEQDFGKVLTKQKVYTQEPSHVAVSSEISAFVNLLNTPINKASMIHSTLKGKATIDDGVSKNLILRPHIYKNNSEYWTDELSNELSKYMQGTNPNMTSESAIYHSLILRSMDKRRFYEIYESYSDKKIQYVLSNQNVDAMLYDTVLTNTEKSLVVASLESKTKLENKNDILGAVKDMYTEDSNVDALSLFASYADTLSSDVTFRVLNSLFPGMLTLKNILETVNTKGVAAPFEYTLLQMLMSKVAGTHYVPYDSLHMFSKSPFLPSLILKIFTVMLQNKSSDIIAYIKERRQLPAQEFTVGVNAPDTKTEDKQLFVRMLPVMLLDIVQEGSEGVCCYR